MATVKFELADHDLSREEKAVVFNAENKDGKIGKLVISKGGIRWYPGKSTKKHHFLTWETFAKKVTLYVSGRVK
jgi:hypothetical protein